MLKGVSDRLRGYILSGEIAGGSILVRKNSNIVHEEYQGYSDIENRIPVSKESVFRLASMSKPVAAAGILLLEQEGKIRISDPVSKYIPAFDKIPVSVKDENGEIRTVPSERPLYIEDLLRHRSGIGHTEISAGMGIDKVDEGISLEERTAYIASFPLDFQPGTQTGYSARCAFDVLGRIIEVVSGMEMEAFLKQRFFEPLSMTDTTFFPDDGQKERTVRLYERSSGVLKDFYAPGVYASPFGFSYPSGSAGLSGTLHDYDEFVRMLSGHGKEILSRETVKKMAVPDQGLASDTGAWGLGVHVFNRKSKSNRGLAQGTFGWSGAFGTHFYIDPVNDVTVTLMVNRLDIGGSGSHVSHGMENAVFESLDLSEE